MRMIKTFLVYLGLAFFVLVVLIPALGMFASLAIFDLQLSYHKAFHQGVGITGLLLIGSWFVKAFWQGFDIFFKGNDKDEKRYH